jgi:molecular chaperone GrpE
MAIIMKVWCAVLLFMTLLNCVEAYIFSRKNSVFCHRAIAKGIIDRNVNRLFCAEETGEVVDLSEENLNSNIIVKFKTKIEETQASIASIREEIKSVEANLEGLEAEFGSEIARVKKEFIRIKERSYEEAVASANNAKVSAIKEVLPVTDNFERAKSLYLPLETDGEKAIMALYENVIVDINKLIADFGCERVATLGQPFDFNFMEAIMMQPSTVYAKDLVCMEYQLGFKVGDRCVRPAMVVVSTGPGPA